MKSILKFSQGKFLFSLFAIIITACLFYSCKKDEDKIIISGKVIDPNQNISVQNVKVELLAQKIESGTWSTNYSLLETDNTVNEGEFYFSIAPIKVSNYRLTFAKENYFNLSVEISPDEVTKNEAYHKTYNVYSEAYLKVHIKNVLPGSPEDYMFYQIKNGTLDCYNCCSDTISEFDGNNVDVTTVCKTYGHQYILIEWNVKENTSLHHYSENVFCNAFDTTSFDIFY